jgi:hypothetical protein
MPLLPAIAIGIAIVTFQTPQARQSQSGTVVGILRTDSGTPLPGVRVAVEPVSNDLDAGLLESISPTDAAGRYVLQNVSPGRYRIVTGRVDSPMYHPGVAEPSQATTIVVVAGQTTEVPDMVFNRTRIAGRVVDLKTGQGRSIKSLTLCCDEDPASSSLTGLRIITTALPRISAPVSEDGSFLFAEVPPGKYFLHAQDPNIAPVAQVIDVGQDDVEGFELKVTSGVRVEGIVTDRLNERVTAVNLTLKPDPGNMMLEAKAAPTDGTMAMIFSVMATAPPAPTFDIRKRLVTEGKPRTMMATAAGEFSFTGVLPGKYTLEVNAPGGNSFSREIEVGTHEPVATTMALPFTRVTGRIAGSDGSALPRLTGSVRFVSSEPDARIVFGFPDDAGYFSVLLAPGDYRLFTETLNVDSSIESISDGVNDLRTQRFIVDGNRQQHIRITVAR